MNDLLSISVKSWEERKNQLESSISELSSKRKDVARKYKEELRHFNKLHSRTAKADEEYELLVEFKNKLEEESAKIRSEMNAISIEKKSLDKERKDIEKEKEYIAIQHEHLDDLQKHLHDTEKDVERKEQEVQNLQADLRAKSMRITKHLSEFESREKQLTENEQRVKRDLERLEDERKRFVDEKRMFSEQNAKQQQEIKGTKTKLEDQAKHLTTLLKSAKDQQREIFVNKQKFDQEKSVFDHQRKLFERDTKSIQPLLENTLTYQRRLYDMQHRVKILSHDVQHFESRRKSILAEIDKLDNTLAERQGALEDVKLKVHEADLELRRVRAEAEHIHQHNKMVDKQLQDRHDRLQKFEKEYLHKDVTLRGEIEKTQIARFKAEQEMVQAKLSKDMLLEKEKVLDSRQKELHKWETTLRNEEVRHAKLRSELKNFESRLRDVELREIALAKTEESIKTMQEEIKHRREEVIRLENDGDVNGLRTKLVKLQNDNLALHNENKNLTGQVEQLKQDMATTEDDLEKQSEAKKQIRSIQLENQHLKEELEILRSDNQKLASIAKGSKTAEPDADVKASLAALDHLMEHLPDEELKKFVASDEFKIVEKVFSRYNIGN